MTKRTKIKELSQLEEIKKTEMKDTIGGYMYPGGLDLANIPIELKHSPNPQSETTTNAIDYQCGYLTGYGQ